MRKNKKKNHLSRRAVCWLDQPAFANGPEEAIEILGCNTVRVEGAKGIHTYEQEVVRIHMRGYLLALYGSGFDLDRFEDGCLQVTGKLIGISWESKNENNF